MSGGITNFSFKASLLLILYCMNSTIHPISIGVVCIATAVSGRFLFLATSGKYISACVDLDWRNRMRSRTGAAADMDFNSGFGICWTLLYRDRAC